MGFMALARFGESDLQPGERIIFRARQHWIIFMGNLLRPLFLILLEVGIGAALVFYGVAEFKMDVLDLVIWVVLAGLITYQLLWVVLKHWIDWKYDEDILTDRRLIDWDQHHLFGKDVGITELESIEDVSVMHKGVWSTLFGYGDVDIQTAATSASKMIGGKTFLMRNVPKPVELQRIISDTVTRRNIEIGRGHSKF